MDKLKNDTIIKSIKYGRYEERKKDEKTPIYVMFD